MRQGNWKLYRQNAKTGWKLYDLSTDPLEMKDLASEHPALVRSLIAKAEASHTPAVSGTWIDESEGFAAFRRQSRAKKK